MARSSILVAAARGAARGFDAGVTAVRIVQALSDVRTPRPPLAARDPARYNARRRALMLLGIARSIAASASLAFDDGARLEAALARLPRAARLPAFAAALAVADLVREWPVRYVEGHALERIYGMTTQRGRSWAADRLKGAAVGVVIAALLAALADAVIARAPRRWPVLALAGTPFLLALANVVAPAFIMPLFNTYVPVEGDLERAIRDLAGRYGAGDAAILRFDMSKQTAKANAFVTGIFGTKRIALGDTLIEGFAQDETLFVVAHELGHYVRRDPWAAILIGTASVAVILAAGEGGVRRISGHESRTVADAATFLFFAQLAGLATTPLVNAFSRAIERRADRFAVAATGDPASGARAFRRLRERNLAEDEAPGWWEAIFASHPSLRSRIARLEA